MSLVVRLFLVNTPAPTDGHYLRAFDPEAHNGFGELVLTPHRADARRVADFAEAFELWRSVPKCRPRRPDGKPNRPLTAYHMEVEPE